MDKPNWNERYSQPEYVFGTEPNAFLKEWAHLLRGPVLCIAEGEGRNGVFLASLGLEVHGVDGSEVGLAKARALAESRGVALAAEVADLADFDPGRARWGAVVSIFAHLPSLVRARRYPLIEESLVPGGIFLHESYSPAQLERDTGGPKNPDFLMTLQQLEASFPSLEPLLLRELVRDVQEGGGHTGLSSVLQFIGRRP